MSYWRDRLVQVMAHSDTQGTELLFASLKLFWGVFLLMPFASLGAGGLQVFWFRVPEAVLAWWFLLLGILQIAGLLSLRLPLRTAATVFGVFTWSVLAASIFASRPSSTLWVLMLVFALANLGMHVRLRRRAL
jgi:hypothetical protein